MLLSILIAVSGQFLTENMGHLSQITAECVDRQNRTIGDCFIDGLNRLPRPILVLGIIALFVWATATLCVLPPLRWCRGPVP